MRLSSSPRPLAVGSNSSPLSLDFVRDLRTRSVRDQNRLFVAEGIRFAHCALRHKASVYGLVYSSRLLQGPLPRSIVEQVRSWGVPALDISPKDYRSVSPGVSGDDEGTAASHQGLLMVLRQRWEKLPTEVRKNECWLGVESLQTSGNLGTLLRSGDAVGASGLIVFDRSPEGSPSGVDPYDPLVIRASMGSIFAHRLIRTTHAAFRKWSGRPDLSVVGGTPEASTDYRCLSYRKPVVLMLGHERGGLSDGQRNTCDRFARIPMVGNPDSLNLAMAGTLMLYEVFNQRHPAKRG